MVLTKRISFEELLSMKPRYFDDMVKIVVDRKNKTMAVSAEMHHDLMYELLDNGSEEKDLWGANIFEDKKIVWESMLNIKRNMFDTNDGTRGRLVKDPIIIDELNEIIFRWIY